MRTKSLFVLIAVAALMLTSPASAVDTDGDGLLDLLDVAGFDPSASGSAFFESRGIQDLDGANQLANLQSLSLAENRITSVESGTFDGLTNLQSLRLSGNQITSLESGDFDGLDNLQELQLWSNQLTSIESGAFQELTHLRRLGLEDNQITSIESGDFRSLTNLRSLSLRANQVTSIESGAFSFVTNLEELHLEENQIISVDSGDFDGLTNLQKLFLNDNQITSIEKGAFHGLPNLHQLWLDGNGFSELNFSGARFEILGKPLRGFFSVDSDEITSLILDDAVLHLGSLQTIVDQTAFITDVSLVGFTFLDENPTDLSNLLGIGTLDNVTVSQTLFALYADEFNAFDAMDGNTVTVVPDLGDYNASGALDVGDLDLQAAAIQGGQNPEAFDLTYDKIVDGDDRTRWVHDLKRTWFGDADLDGEFNSTDFGAVLAGGQYEDDVALNSSWTTGDFNADGEFDSSDLSFALADGGYEQGPRLATAAVPEPSTAFLLCIGLLAIMRRR